MDKRIVFTGKQEVSIEDFTPVSPVAEEVTVKIICSLISSGTEMIVFNRQFAEGTHWDNWIKYPFYPGYAAVGIITETGKDVSGLKVGDRVALRCAHASTATVNQNECYLVPSGVASEDAVWFALAKIASMGIRVCDSLVGKTTAVIGAGPIGQMVARWLLAAGAQSTVIVDTEKQRLEFAKHGGISQTISSSIGNSIEQLRNFNGGKLSEIVIDSTGHPQAFTEALSAVEDFGKLVLLGDTGHPEQQHLTPDLLMRGLSVIGAHDCHENENWNSQKVISLFFNLCNTGRMNVSNLISHRFSFEQCADAYKLLNTNRAETMGVLFEWSTE